MLCVIFSTRWGYFFTASKRSPIFRPIFSVGANKSLQRRVEGFHDVTYATAQWRKRVRLGRIHALLEYNPCAEGSRGPPLYYLRSPPLLCVRAQQPRRYNTPFFYKANRGWRSGSASSQITHRLELVFTRVSASAYKYHWDDRLEKTCDRGMNWRRFSKRPIRFADRYSGWNFFLRSWISNRWYILFYAICIIILHILNIAMNILDIHI